MQGLAEITFQLRHGMATESHYVNFVYRAAWFPVPWAGCLFSCLGFGGFATQHIFVSEPFWPWKDVWPHFIFITLMKATEVSREPEEATCGALPYTTERPLGGGSQLERAHCFRRLLALQTKRMLSLNVALTSLCHISKSRLIATRV